MKERFEKYRRYLEEHRAHLPPGTLAFASAEWHYDPEYHECPHDAWVQSIAVRELSPDDAPARRSVEIEARLLGAYHDGVITLVYRAVRSYPLSLVGESARRGHGDWLIDEVRVSEQGAVLHEVRFFHGGRWLIECGDIEYRWEPFET